jgi:hypothetical protein
MGRRVEMQIDEQQIVHVLMEGGEDDKAADVLQRLPDRVDEGRMRVRLAALSSIRSTRWHGLAERKPAHTCAPSTCTCGEM